MFDFLDNKLKHGDKEMNRETGSKEKLVRKKER